MTDLATLRAAEADARDQARDLIDKAVTESMLLAHYSHLQATGEGRIAGKCMDEPCYSAWTNARNVLDDYAEKVEARVKLATTGEIVGGAQVLSLLADAEKFGLRPQPCAACGTEQLTHCPNCDEPWPTLAP